jgi:hypothetical protein
MRFHINKQQTGRGIGKIFSSAFNFLRKVIFPAIAKSPIAKAAGKSLASGAVNVLADTVSGEKTLNESTRENLHKSLKQVGQAMQKLDTPKVEKNNKKSYKRKKAAFKTAKKNSFFFE